jgi:hypothetical protein
MLRPLCPRCGDNFSVARLSALARNASFPHAALWAPAARPPTRGRWFVSAVIVGLFLCAATGFTLLWPAMAISLGICAEVLASWERPEAPAADKQARARWEAAYYCGTHDRVFLIGEGSGCSLEQFAQLIRPAAAGAPPGGPEATRRQSEAQPGVQLEQERAAGPVGASVAEPSPNPLEQAA